uniref:Retrotransposon gag domain-containing protein n=1 Tax=Romanomermis culicivorax TaxID=13658 RepID=A0A915J4D5_ROMCU
MHDRLKNALILAFPNHHDALYHRQLLNERKQGRNETAQAYFNELEKLARLSYPTFDVNACSNMLEPMFLAGLQDDMRQVLKFKCFRDIQSLVDEAVLSNKEILRDSTATNPIPIRYSNPCKFPLFKKTLCKSK